MRNAAVSLEAVTHFLVKGSRAQQSNFQEEDQMVKERRRCKWWNRGFCKEKDWWTFYHPSGDCHANLQGRCSSKGCNTLRHRKVCKFFLTEEGCLREEMCAYLHPNKNLDKVMVGKKWRLRKKEVMMKLKK